MLLLMAGLLVAVPLLAQPGQDLLREYHRGWELTGQFRFEEAIPALRGIIGKDRTFEHAYRTLAEAYCWSKRDREGEAYFAELATRDANDPMPYLGLQWMHHARGMWRERGEAALACVARSAQGSGPIACYRSLADALLLRHGRSPTAKEIRRALPQRTGNPARHIASIYQLFFERKAKEAIQETAAKAIAEARAAGDRALQATILEMLATMIPGGMPSHPAVNNALLEVERLFSEAGDRDQQLATGMGVAQRMIQNGDPAGGLEKLEAVMQLAESWGHQRAQSDGLLVLARHADQAGDCDRAIALYRQAAAFPDKVSPVNSFAAYERIGHCYKRVGDYQKAIEAYQTIGERVGTDHALYAYVSRYVGDAYEETGDAWRALENHQQSLRLFRMQPGIPGRNRVGATLTRIGRIYANLGDTAMAETYFRDARLQISGDPDPMQRLLSEWGGVYLRTGRPREAYRAFSQVLILGEQTRNPTFEIPAIIGKGRAQAQMGETSKAIATLRVGLALAERHEARPMIAEAHLELGKALLGQKDSTLAAEQYRAALAAAELAGLVRIASAAHEALAALSTDAEAWEHLRAAITLLEQLRNQVPGPNLRTSFAGQTWQVYQKAIRSQLGRHRTAPEGGFDREAFHLAERGRARAFLDSLSEAATRMERGLTAAQRAEKGQLAAAVSRAAWEMLRKPGPLAQRRIEEAEQRLQVWATNLHAARPELRDVQYPQALNVSETQASLPDSDTVVVSFVLDEPRSHAFVVGRSDFTVVPLAGQRAVEAAVNGLRRGVANIPREERDLETYQEPASRLYTLLLQPLAAALRGRSKLIVVPDGVLHYLPFEALLKTRQPARFLVEDFAITYVPSASVLGTLREADKQRSVSRRRDLVAFGDPNFGSGVAPQSEVRGLLERNGVLRLGGLPNTRVEVNRIGALYPAAQRRTFLGAGATEEAVKSENLERYRQIHFATHAVVDERFPLRSAVVLSAGATGAEDGLLTVAEIYDLKLNADLVVLSACQSGLGALVRGEGLVGLTKALFSAGTSRVAVSLWNVNDVTTAGLMESLYKGMIAGKPPAAALRDAKLGMIRSGARNLRHPYFWAPFVLAGLF